MLNQLLFWIYLYMIGFIAAACPSQIVINSATSSSICTYSFTASGANCNFVKCMAEEGGARNKQTQQAGWSECFSICCSPIASQLSSQGSSVDLLLQCAKINQQKIDITIGLTVGLTLTLLFGLSGLFICCCRQQCPLYALRERCMKAIRDRKKGDLDATENSRIGRQIVLQVQNRTKIYESDEKESAIEIVDSFIGKSPIFLLKSKCSICQDLKPTTSLSCKHEFHTKCIGEWFQTRISCPSCQQKNLRFIKIYCQRCRQQIKIMDLARFISAFRKGSKIPCKFCSDS